MTDQVKRLEGDLSARGLRFGIAASRFNDLIVEKLLDGAIGTLLQHGAEAGDVVVARVPGAFEIPVVLDKMAASRRFDGLIALGCIIRGATPHFDYVAGQAANGLSAVALKHQIPVGFGILTVETIEQALERAGTKAGNKGVDAALAAIETATLLRRLEA